MSLRALCLLLFSLAAPTCAFAEEFPPIYNSEKSTTSPLAPEEVVRTAKLPDGFRLSVFAAEPAVQNPIAIATDERGRLWVVENYTWAGASLGVWDDKLRDRVVILTDTDGDGRHDERKVFWDAGRKATSVEIGFGGVWVLTLPHLLFIPDKDRDDVPDGPPVVVLDGIDEKSVGHTPANGLRWGPDGWLYARHGIQGTSNIGKPEASDSQRVKINTGVWRYHPVRGTVEAVLHGMTNTWGFDFDQHGEMFVINTVIGHLWHVVPGAHTKRMYGTDINPHSYGLIEQVADHVHWDTGESWSDIRKGVSDKTSAAGGGHAHIGLMIYQGDNWPEQYRGGVYTLNLHGQRLNRDILAREGAGYTAHHGEDICFLSDPWYRGMDLITGPDGGVYISDWSDTGECHDHDGVHRGSGRIYKLTYGEPKKVLAFDMTTYDDQRLVELQNHPNDWWARQARRVIQERTAAADKLEAGLQPSVAVTQAVVSVTLETAKDPAHRLRLLWAAHAAGADVDMDLEKVFRNSKNEHERVWRLRMAAEQFTPDDEQFPTELAESIAKLAGTEPSGLVQLYMASALQRMTLEQRWPVAEALCSHKEFAGDRMLPLMIWYGIEPAVPRDRGRAIKLISTSKIPLVRQYIARRLTEDIESQSATVETLLQLADRSEQVARDIVAGMAEALRGWSRAPQPAAWTATAAKLSVSGSDEVKQHVQELGIVFGDGRASGDLLKIALDGDHDPNARRQALRTLLGGKPDNIVATLQNMSADRVLAIEAIRGLAAYDHPDTPTWLLKSWDRYGPAERSEAINTLTSRVVYAQALLDMLRKKRIAPGDISAFHARQISALGDAKLDQQLAELWGAVRESAVDKRETIDRLKTELTAKALAAAKPTHGRALFQKACANCHVLFGAGRKVGPDLTGSNRKNLDYLLENIVDPGASVGADFRAWVAVLDDGRVLNGVITEQSERTVTLQTAQEPVTLDRKSIDTFERTANSLMPDGLLQNLSEDDIRDLVAYLMSPEQVPMAE